jgi:YD repeat-containing protein
MERKTTSGWHLVALVAVLTLVPGTSHAQPGAAGNEIGFQPNRDYLSLQPFESLDTVSGNLVLTFTDLLLPGNGGRELRFERAYNNQTVSQGAGRWDFGISGLPISVFQRPIPRNTNIQDTIEGHRQWSPTFLMADGSDLRTTFMQTPIAKDATTIRWVATPNFWKYDRDTRKLYLPDGIVATYEAVDNAKARLLSYTDPFGNTVTLTWTPGLLRVTQSLGSQPSREVLRYLDAAGYPTRMEYDGKTWYYDYQPGLDGRLIQVRPPAGGPWVFSYEAPTSPGTTLRQITTPLGGRISYEYANKQFPTGFPPPNDFETRYVMTNRTADGLENSGTWQFDYGVSNPGGDPSGVLVTLPSGYSIGYSYLPLPNVLAGAWTLAVRFILDVDGSTFLEMEERSYTTVRAVPNGWVTPEVTLRRTTRGGRAYTTTYTYDTANVATLAQYHNPIRIDETGAAGELSRSTTRTYRHLTAPNYIVGLPTIETVTVNGQSVLKLWDYDGTTGFKTLENAYGIETRFAPDSVGNLQTITKGNGKTATYSYSNGVMSGMSTPGVALSRQINANGTVASETVGGRTTRYTEYDGLFRLKRTEPPVGNPVTVDYDDTARTVTTRRGASVSTSTLDGFGRTIRTQNGAGIQTVTCYDAQGRKTFESLPFDGPSTGCAGPGTTFTYDWLGRVTREQNGDNTFRRFEYVGNTTTYVDENDRPTVLTRKAFGHPDDGRLTGVLDADSKQWTYAYDAIGQVTSVAGTDGITRTWTYDNQRPTLLASETHPESGTVTYQVYDGAGVLKQKRDNKGTVFVYEHDGNDRVTRITAGSDVTTVSYEQGSDKRVVTTTPEATSIFSYDAGGRIQSRTDLVDGKSFTATFAYDGNDNVREITYPSGRRVGYEYDAENRVSRVFNGYSPTEVYASNMTYHASDGITQYLAGNGLATTIGYHAARHWMSGVSVGQLLQLTYEFDNVGNVQAIRDSRAGMDQTFTYDRLDRLETVTSQTYPSFSFLYDAHGNRRDAGGSTYTYFPGTFRLQSMNGLNMTYDANGNLETGPQAAFTYTSTNMMRTSLVGGVSASYVYDADDVRVKKTVTGGATTYFMRGLTGQLMTEWINTSPAAQVRDHIYAGPRLIGVFTATQPAQ